MAVPPFAPLWGWSFVGSSASFRSGPAFLRVGKWQDGSLRAVFQNFYGKGPASSSGFMGPGVPLGWLPPAKLMTSLSVVAGETKDMPIISESSTKRIWAVLPAPTKEKGFLHIEFFR
jgi:hypothetical protein